MRSTASRGERYRPAATGGCCPRVAPTGSLRREPPRRPRFLIVVDSVGLGPHETHNDHEGCRGGVELVSVPCCAGLGQFDLIQVLLNAPELDIELVESLSRPLLSIMTIDVGLSVPIELPLSLDAV
jgi:hypothetical protein